ncbi:hypothetical protein [Minisyncoccus archaeiphilus]|uniref:hypothetical protein n=1 Tax=Minisyncoccus archaeiphilus TaxID=3238481 RepID=UPI00399D537B
MKITIYETRKSVKEDKSKNKELIIINFAFFVSKNSIKNKKEKIEKIEDKVINKCPDLLIVKK